MEYLSFIIAPAITAGFFLLDLSKSHNLFYNWFQPIRKNTLCAYLFNFFVIGLLFYCLYYWGIKGFNKDPNEIVEHIISKKTPIWLNGVLQAGVVAWFTHGFCTSRTIPSIDTTIELFLEKRFFRNFESDIIDDSNRGRLIVARIIIKKYNKKNVPDLDLNMFSNKIRTYVIDNKKSIKPEDIATVQGMVEDMESVSSIDTAVAFALNDFTPKKIKAILGDSQTDGKRCRLGPSVGCPIAVC